MNLGRSAALTGFVDAARAAGLDPIKLAAEVGLPVAAFADPDLKISSVTTWAIYELAAERSGMPDFALRVAEKRKLSNLGLLGLLAREQPTLRRAVATLAQFVWLQTDSLILHLEETEDVGILRYATTIPVGPQMSELAIGVGWGILRTLVGEGLKPQDICFTHAAPADISTHRRVFGRAPLFEQDFFGIVLLLSDLDRPIAAADPDMARQVTRYVDKVTSGRGATFGDKVRDLIVMMLPNGSCSADRVAQSLAMDRRTLQRHLAAEGTSFTLLLESTRRNLAESLLTSSGRSLQRIAEILGFSSLSAFAHWFRRQFGRSASEYRAQRFKRIDPPPPTGRDQLQMI